jgi:adenylate cyclase
MNFLKNLSHIGVTGDLPAREIKHVVFLNVVVLLVFVIGANTIMIAAFYLPATEIEFITVIIHIASIQGALLWNHWRKYLAARIWFSVIAAFFLTFHTVLLGTESRWHFFLAVCVFLLFYMFPPREKFWMYPLIGVFSLCFIGVELFCPRDGLLTGMPQEYILLLYYNNTIGVLFCALSMGGVGYVTIRNADDNLEREHARSESLLRNILPASIAERLKSSPDSIADSYSEATILFVDIVGFTKIAESVPPDALVSLLNTIFSEIDDLTEKYGLEKIKTIGDAYMVVAGAPERRPDHAGGMAAMSLEIKDSFDKLNRAGGHALDFRIGIHSGPVVAGVIGKKKFSYDLWGDSVNTAARLEAHGVPGEIQVSAHVRDLLKDKFQFVERGMVELKGKGKVLTYLLRGA